MIASSNACRLTGASSIASSMARRRSKEICFPGSTLRSPVSLRSLRDPSCFSVRAAATVGAGSLNNLSYMLRVFSRSVSCLRSAGNISSCISDVSASAGAFALGSACTFNGLALSSAFCTSPWSRVRSLSSNVSCKPFSLVASRRLAFAVAIFSAVPGAACRAVTSVRYFASAALICFSNDVYASCAVVSFVCSVRFAAPWACATAAVAVSTRSLAFVSCTFIRAMLFASGCKGTLASA